MHVMQRIVITAVAVTALAVTAGYARAQRAPDLATLDRGDGISKVGVDLGFDIIDGPYDAALRIEPYGQYITRMGLGIYGAFPIARSFGGAGGAQPDDTFAIGDLDVGLLYVYEPSPTLSWVFRGGVGLPIASDSADGVLTNFLATYPRFTDLALLAPNSFVVRAAVSPLIHADRLYLRIDLGFDAGIDDDDNGHEMIRFNAGGGIDLGVIALGLELVNIYDLDKFAGNEHFAHTVAGTVRIMGKSLQPLIAVGTPLDSSARDVVPFFASVGIQYVPH